MKNKVLFSLYVDVLYFNSKQISRSGPFWQITENL